MEARGEESPQRHIDLGLRDKALMYGLNQSGIVSPAGCICTGFHRSCAGMRYIRREMMAAGRVEIRDCTAVGGYKSVEFPKAAKVLLEQHLIGTAWLAVDGVIDTHHRICVGLCDGRAKRRKVCVFQVARDRKSTRLNSSHRCI